MMQGKGQFSLHCLQLQVELHLSLFAFEQYKIEGFQRIMFERTSVTLNKLPVLSPGSIAATARHEFPREIVLSCPQCSWPGWLPDWVAI